MQQKPEQGTASIPVMALRAAVAGSDRPRITSPWLLTKTNQNNQGIGTGSFVGVPREPETSCLPTAAQCPWR